MSTKFTVILLQRQHLGHDPGIANDMPSEPRSSVSRIRSGPSRVWTSKRPLAWTGTYCSRRESVSSLEASYARRGTRADFNSYDSSTIDNFLLCN